MKAQAYEVRALPTRKTRPCIYHFSLLSVVDAEMIRIVFEDDAVSPSELESEQYLASYIIDKKQDVSRIRLVRASTLKKAISDYDKLHVFNCKVFSDYCNEFYDGVLEDWSRTKIFIEEFRSAVWLPLHLRIYKTFKKDVKRESIGLSWRSEHSDVAVTLPLEDEHLIVLNKDVRSNAAIKKALADIYRYKGSFQFSDNEDIPF
jgi:hypothetical protein